MDIEGRKTLYAKLNEISGYDDVKKIHLEMSSYLEELHNNGLFISPLNPDSIYFEPFFDKEKINTDNLYYLNRMDRNEKESAIEQNKEFLAAIILFGSLGILDKISLGTVNMIKNDLEKYLDIATVDEDDKDYYRSIFIEDGKPYYHEHINNKKYLVSNDGASDNLGISKTKSTAYSGLGGVEYDNNKVSHGNATWYILAALTVMFSVTAVILFIMSGK